MDSIKIKKLEEVKSDRSKDLNTEIFDDYSDQKRRKKLMVLNYSQSIRIR